MFTAETDGTDAVHGRTADWVALAGSAWTLVFAAATDRTRRDPWFVRTEEYPGVGSSSRTTRGCPSRPGRRSSAGSSSSSPTAAWTARRPPPWWPRR